MNIIYVGSTRYKFDGYLTIGKSYKELNKSYEDLELFPDSKVVKAYYFIINDKLQKRKYNKEYFKTIDEIRDNKLEQLGI